MVPKLEVPVSRGHARAQADPGYLHEKGPGRPRDKVRGQELALASAEQGFATARQDVGSRHQDGLAGVPVDEVKAREWYRKAVAEDCLPSLTAPGHMLLNGKGGGGSDHVAGLS
ncbi:tetratricopeptide repeat protein [Tabrizicola sp. YIM 78059]|uniref:tetratricopeptide repeat protein n=1 Tax=Tabrizicola sp. YIM 78059 TaxID=2529861 RepID=UPI00352F0228